MKVGTDHRIISSLCLRCGKELSGASGVGVDAPPDPGDVTVCIYCGHIMAFADDLTMRPLTTAEAHAVADDERVLAVQAARATLEPKP
jgi:DNA-directed RNA polymerase subunit RPC12/RpoP